MPKQILTILTLLCLAIFTMDSASASWLDKLKETATELTDKAGEALKEADPEAPTTSDGEGQPQSPATVSPAKPAAPETKTVTKPAAPKAAQPAPVANTGNNDKTLVRNIQQELKRLGYSIGVDGAYGPNTKKQIMAFEQSQSLEPSGDASVELLAKLKETPTPQAAEPAATTTTTAAPAPKAVEPKAPEPKVEQAAAPTKSLNPHDYDRAYAYEGSAPQLKGAWLLIKDKLPERFYAEIKGNELFAQRDLRSMEVPPGVKIDIRSLVGKDFRKTDSYDPPSVVLIRFGGNVITAKNISGGGSANLRFHAKGPEVAALLAHIQAGNDFEFRVDNFEPFLYSKDWTTFTSPPPEIAAAKQAEKDKQAAAQAAAKAEKEKKAAYAGTLSPVQKTAFEQCEQNSSAKNFYDCQCIAQNIDPHVDRVAADNLEELKKLFVYHYGEDGQKAFNNIDKSKMTEKQKAERKKAMQERMDKDKQQMADLQNKAAWDDKLRKQLVNTAGLWAYKDSTCKVGDGWREKEYSQCMKSSSTKNIKGKTPEEYCTCSADTVAKLWTGSNQSYSSKVAVSLPVQARTQCRN